MKSMFAIPRVTLAALAALIWSCNQAAAPEEDAAESGRVASAVAILDPTQGNTASGVVTFTQVPGGVRVFATLTGLTPGDHGFHVHEGRECGHDGSAAGGHFNPDGTPHGLPGDPQQHAGDMGNLTADASGRAVLDRVFPGLSLHGSRSILGRAVIVHAAADDGSQPTGNSGARVACGIILRPQKFAAAEMHPTPGNTARGTVKFIRVRRGTLVLARFTGLTPGQHGFHIHEFGDCGMGGNAAGGHFNPEGSPHGLPGAGTPLHRGDMGNLQADASGKAHFARLFEHVRLDGPFSVLGRGVIVHADPDDGSQPTGNSGARVACGKILPLKH